MRLFERQRLRNDTPDAEEDSKCGIDKCMRYCVPSSQLSLEMMCLEASVNSVGASRRILHQNLGSLSHSVVLGEATAHLWLCTILDL